MGQQPQRFSPFSGSLKWVRGGASYPSFSSASFYGGKALAGRFSGRGEKGIDREMEEVTDGER